MLTQRALFLSVIFASIPFSGLLQVGYSPSSAELWLLSLAFGMVGFVIGLLFGRSLAYGPIYALALYFFFDSNIYESGWFLALVLMAIVLTMAVGMQKIGSWALPVVTAFVGVFSLASVLQSGGPLVAWSGPEQPQRSTMAEHQRPALIHLILDEYMSPEAIPDSIPPDHPAGRIFSDMVERGFRVYERAQAISDKTHTSVSALFDLSAETTNYTRQPSGAKWAFVLKQNRLVDTLRQQGYLLTVLQSNYLELCPESDGVRCATYNRANNMQVFERSGFTIPKRLHLAMLSMHEAYINKGRMKVLLYEEFLKLLLGDKISFDYFARPLLMLDLLDAMERGDYLPQRGEALVAHLLLPHFPYILDPDCRLKDVSGWTYPSRHAVMGELPDIYAGYWDQVACLHSRLLRIIDRQAVGAETILILNGDHGSRISKRTEMESDADLKAAFLAIRGANIDPGRESDTVLLQDIISQFYLNQR